MRTRIAQWTATACMAGVLALASGCATTNVAEMDELRSAVNAANATAKEAAKDAAAARAEAGRASRTANRALSAAREAQACCVANSEKIERMFKKSMKK